MTSVEVKNQSYQKRTFEKNREVNKNCFSHDVHIDQMPTKIKTESSLRISTSNLLSNSNYLQELPLFESNLDRE